MRTLTLVLLMVVSVSHGRGAELVTQADLLLRLIDLDRLMQPPTADERTRMFSSYDRASQIAADGTLVHWDANYDRAQYLRRDDDGWDVLAEVDGPGAITRMWSANPEGRVQFVLDGDVVVDGPFADIFRGRPWRLMDYNAQRGLTTYCPVGFDKSCVVRIKDSTSYYQINVIEFAAGTRVQRFDPNFDAAALAAHARVAKAFADGFSYEQIKGERDWERAATEPVSLAPLATHELEIGGGGTLRALHCVVAEPNRPWPPHALHQCVLKVYVDGESAPRVEAPLIDFFGSGFSPRAHHSLLASVSEPTQTEGVGRSRQLVSFWPMPFADGLRIEVVNLGFAPVGPLLLDALYHDAPPSADALRFNARFRKEDPATELDVPVLDVAGSGRVTGLLLNIDCPREEWWGEGDEKIWIDGERFPSYFGTGTEDYFNDAWGLRPHGHALHGVTRAGLYGKASMYRWHTADSIDFHEQIRFTIENWQHRREWDTYYATLVYWYGSAASSETFRPLRQEDLRPPGLRVPDSIEIETNAAILRGCTTRVTQDQVRVELSSGGGVAVTGGCPMPVDINIPGPRPDVYRLRLRVASQEPFGEFTVHMLDGRKLGTVRYDASAGGWHDVGVVRLAERDNVVRMRPPRDLLLDCWRLAPVPRVGDAFEAEALEWSSESSPELVWGDATWSGGALMRLMLDPNASATCVLPPRPVGEFAGLTVHLLGDPNGGPATVLLTDAELASIDVKAAQPTQQTVYLGAAAWSDRPHKLTFRNAGATPIGFGVDALAVRPVRSPHALEVEHLKVLAADRAASMQQVLGGGWSNHAQLLCKPAGPPAWIELALPVRRAGRYRLGVAYTRSFDYGVVQTHLDGAPLGPRIDAFGELEPGPITDLGEHELSAGVHKLRIELVGRNEKSPGYLFGVDCVLLTPVEGDGG